MSIQLSQAELDTVRKILKENVAGVPAAAYGSRVSKRARKWSDLDIMLTPPSPLPLGKLAELRNAFMESDLTIRVDVTDANRVDPEFLKTVLAHSETLL